METVLQEIVEAADAWFATGRTRRAGVEYERFQAGLKAGCDALLTQRREELAALEQMEFDVAVTATANDEEADDDGEEES